jgi:flagellar basal-body rod protein FlgF/flagellar basal-body rod protein FlgG
MYVSASGANAQSKRMDVIANNLANIDTPGFKKDFPVLQARHAEAIEKGQVPQGMGRPEDIGGGVSFEEIVTDFETGTLKSTGIETDLAINGEGFFVVQKDGQPLLTRAGNFRFTGEGFLQTQDGLPVLSTDNNPIQIDPSLPRSFEVDGTIRQGGDVFELAVVKPNSLGDLVKSGETFFTPLAETPAVPLGERQVLSGYQEQSTVNSATEMMSMIEASRAYEANVKMIQSQDQALGTLISRILGQ